MKYVGVKTTGELRLHEVKEPQTDEIYMAVEDTKVGASPIKPYQFVKWDGTKWVEVPDVQLATDLDVSEAIGSLEGKIPSDTSTTNKLVNESGLQDAIDNASESWSTGFTPKGESSVSDLNDLATQSNGDSYIVTDSGTLTDGTLAVVAGDQVAWDATNSVWYKLPQYALKQFGTNAINNLPTTITSFRTGDVIAVDGPSGAAKMSKDDLLKEMAAPADVSFRVLSYVMGESYKVNSASYSDGVASSLNVTFVDGKNGSIAITRDSDGNASSVVVAYDGTDYQITVTRNSDGNVTGTSISEVA